MKLMVDKLRLPFHLGLFVMLFFVPRLLFAQEDNMHIDRDSMRIKMQGGQSVSPVDLYPVKLPEYPVYRPERLRQPPEFTLDKNVMRLPYQTNPSLLFRGDYSTGGILKQFPRGALFGFGGQTSLPGIGRFNNASVGYRHIWNDKLELQLSANAVKMNMTHFAGQSFSTSGTLLYRPSERVAFKLFGSYAIGNAYGMDTHYYGATMSLDMSERFGMEVGVQRYYDSMQRHWETVPVVIPYYKFDKFKLGLDVGGILYEILRNVVFEDRGIDGGSTIAPPRFQMPPLK